MSVESLPPAPAYPLAAGPRRSQRAQRPPVVIVGGEINALTIARSLGRYGVTVHALSIPSSPVRYSRYARWIALANSISVWRDFLLGNQSRYLHGSVLLAASDPALELLRNDYHDLRRLYLIDDMDTVAQEQMLNKLSTYEAARAAGVKTPGFWTVDNLEQLQSVRDSLTFPLLVKPLFSHVFDAKHGRKHFFAKHFDDLIQSWRRVLADGIEAMLVEWIPGLDDRLCSYYTYLDASGQPLFTLTKRVIRRNSPGEGGACYHITDWVPEVCEPSLKLLRHVGLRGLANVEFKSDPRDGQLKLIECNARFTAPIYLLQRAGIDLARFVYNRVVGIPQEPLTTFRQGLRLWYPWEDFHAFRSLQRRGDISWFGWLKSIAHRQIFPIFSGSDPMPSFAEQFCRAKRRLRVSKQS